MQVNTLAAERLYSLAGDWAELSHDTILFDICCGTGTIGLTLARRVGMVTAIFLLTLSVEPYYSFLFNVVQSEQPLSYCFSSIFFQLI